MLRRAILAIPMALVWMVLTATLNIEGFLVGFVVALAVLTLVSESKTPLKLNNLPDQVLALLIHIVTLARDIYLSGVDVAKRVIDPKLPMKQGILAVNTQDEHERDIVAALSAHAITITPGELVLDFDGGKTMFVHCLDVEASAKSADAAQTRRLKLFRRILGG